MIPIKDWPDGAVAHCAHLPFDDPPGAFICIEKEGDGTKFHLFDLNASGYGLPPGTITIRPDAALIAERDQLQAENEALRLRVEGLEMACNIASGLKDIRND